MCNCIILSKNSETSWKNARRETPFYILPFRGIVPNFSKLFFLKRALFVFEEFLGQGWVLGFHCHGLWGSPFQGFLCFSFLHFFFPFLRAAFSSPSHVSVPFQGFGFCCFRAAGFSHGWWETSTEQRHWLQNGCNEKMFAIRKVAVLKKG